MRFFIFIVFLFKSSSLYSQEKAKPTSLKEIHLDSRQMEEIQTDLPIKEIYVDKSNSLWILGNHSLWKWLPHRSLLHQIQLPTTEKLKHLAGDGDTIFVSNDSNLFQIESKPLKILSIRSPAKETLSLGLQIEEQNIYWIRSNGIYFYDSNTQKLKKIYDHILLGDQEDKYLFSPENKTLWMLQNNQLSHMKYQKDKKPNKIIKDAKSINEFHINKDEVLAVSDKAIYRYAKRGYLIQTIPVLTNRRILTSTFVNQTHSFTFQDKLLEIHDDNKKTSHYFLDVGNLERAKSMVLNDNKLAIILDGKPRLFEIPLSHTTK